MALSVNDAVTLIGSLQHLHDTTGASTRNQMRDVLRRLSSDDVIKAAVRIQQLGIMEHVLSGKTPVAEVVEGATCANV